MSNSRFEEIAIKDLCVKLTDYVANGSFKTIADNVNYQKTGYARLIRLLDYNKDYNLKDSVWVDKKGYDFLKKSSLFGGEIIISNVGEYAGTAFLAPKLPYPTTLAPNSIMLTTKDNDLFYYYYFKSPLGYMQIRNIVSSSGQPKFNKTNFKEIIVPRPDLKFQEHVANHLYTIDKKIANNKKINTELESMAKTLYDYWFLQFEFPNAEGKPYKSSGGKMVYNEQLKKEIPEGWEVSKVSKKSRMISGYPFKTEDFSPNGKYKLYTIKNVQDGFINSDVDNTLGVLPSDIDENCILSYGDIIMSLTGNVGRTGLVYENNALLNQRVLKIIPNKNFFNYLYLTFRQDSFKNIMQRISGGTSQKNLSPNQVGDFLITIPDVKILDSFNEKLDGFFDLIVKNLRQNQELTSLRDFLLPLLMNGQVTFKDKDEKENQPIILNYMDKFNRWKETQGYAARGDVDDEILKKIFDAMDDDDKK